MKNDFRFAKDNKDYSSNTERKSCIRQYSMNAILKKWGFLLMHNIDCIEALIRMLFIIKGS